MQTQNAFSLFCKLSCNPPSELEAVEYSCRGREIADTLSGIRKSVLRDKKTVSKFEPGDKPEMSLLNRGDGLIHGDIPGKKLKDNADKDSDWPKLILKGSHC